VKGKWLLVIAGPSLAFVIGSVLVMLLLPHPVPRNASPAQRLYLANCATCHGADGRGSWRATLFLMRPGNLADRQVMDPLSDDYLVSLIKNGGAPLGKPGMPAFGYHLSDAEIRELIAYVRRLPRR
jgi:mono/diheme cytochrome c family protein